MEAVRVTSVTGSSGTATTRSRPLARVLRIRVFQIFCGIGCMVMAAVAFIEEKRFNVAVGLVSGALTVMAAGVSIQHSNYFDDMYQAWHVNEARHPSRIQLPGIFTKIHMPVLGVALTWLIAGVGNTVLVTLTVMTLNRGQLSETLLTLCVIEILLVTGLLVSAALVVWIDYRVLQEHAV